MSDGVVDSVKQVLEERLKNPLWGFIILAWFWFNWPNLAMLFMSDAPVKFRIDYILSQDFFYLHYIIAPVLSGGLLAIASPYAQLLLSRAHKWADDRYRYNVYLSKARGFEEEIKLSKLRVQSDRAVDFESAKIEADIKAEVERGKREELATQELESKKQALSEELEAIKHLVSVENETKETIRIEKEKLQDLIFRCMILLNKMLDAHDAESFDELKKEAEDLFTVDDFQMSTIRNTLKDNKELSSEQTFSLFDKFEERLNAGKFKFKT